MVQPVDVSFNRPFKSAVERFTSQHMQDYLQSYVQGKFDASSRRILFTRWVGQAWEEVSADREMVKRSFRKCGIVVAVDGSEDSKINISELEEYAVKIRITMNIQMMKTPLQTVIKTSRVAVVVHVIDLFM